MVWIRNCNKHTFESYWFFPWFFLLAMNTFPILNFSCRLNEVTNKEELLYFNSKESSNISPKLFLSMTKSSNPRQQLQFSIDNKVLIISLCFRATITDIHWKLNIAYFSIKAKLGGCLDNCQLCLNLFQLV